MPSFLESFYSAAFYRRVARTWRPVSLLYLLAVLALCWTPAIIRLHLRFTHALQRFENEELPQFPVIRFANGEISTPEARPYLLSFGGRQSPLALIIDTSGRITSLDGQTAEFLLTKHQMIIRQKTGDVRSYDLSTSKAKPFVFNPTVIKRILRPLKFWAFTALYAGLFILSYLKRLIQAFFMALGGLLLVTLMNIELDLGALLSLAIVSLTPAMVVESLLGLTDKWAPWGLLVGMILIFGYFIFALNAASDQGAE